MWASGVSFRDFHRATNHAFDHSGSGRGNELIPISPFHATASPCLHVQSMFNTCYRLFQLIYVIDMVASGQEQENTHVILPESGEPKLYPPPICYLSDRFL